MPPDAPPPVMSVHFRDKVFMVEAEAGAEGRRKFEDSVRRILGLDSDQVCGWARVAHGVEGLGPLHCAV